MNEHVDIEDLLKDPLTAEVQEHLRCCDLCLQIYEDIRLLNLDLKELNHKIEIPDSVDEQVYLEASNRSRDIRKTLFRKNILASVGAIAAVVICSFVLFFNLSPKQYLAADINGDGEINVLDSLVLAQKIDRQSFNEEIDLNKDGQLNHEDLQILRTAVVNLDGRVP